MTGKCEAQAGAPVLSCSKLSVHYGGSIAIRSLDLEVQAGRMVGVLGANGAGKTSLVNALAGWSRGKAVVDGVVHLGNRDISSLPAHQRAREGLLLVPEGRNVFGALTVEEHFKLVSRPDESKDRFVLNRSEAYEMFPRLMERRAHKGIELSGGERQMLAVVCALMAGPRALLLDEPSIGLAPLLVIDLLQRVRGLVDRGLAVLLVEQNAHAALQVVDHVVVLERGRMLAEGTADELRHDERIAEAYLGVDAPGVNT